MRKLGTPRLLVLAAPLLLTALVGLADSDVALAQGAPSAKPKAAPTAAPKADAKPTGAKPSAKPAPAAASPAPKTEKPAAPKADKDKGDKADKKPEDARAARMSGVERWVDATPDDLAKSALARAKASADDAVAGLLLATSMHEFAAPGDVTRGLGEIAKGSGEAAGEARVLAQMLTPVPWGKTWAGWANTSFETGADSTGLVKALQVIGPFQDMGGGLGRQEGPEGGDSSFLDADADYSWGDFEVKPRRVVPDWVTAQGFPLDLMIHPRTESCTYLVSKVSFPQNPKSVVVRVASSGSARVIWDGETVAWNEDVNARAVLDRFAVQIELDAGPHLVAVKTCSSPQPDDGRVRIRFTDESGAPINVEASSDLKGLADDRAHAAPVPDALAKKVQTTPTSKPGAKPAADAPKPPATKDPKAKAAAPKAAPAKEAATATTKPAAKPAAKPSKVKWKTIETPLAKALAMGEGGSVDQAIVAAVARTLAGADDTRSPKAPGLLDRIAKDPAVTPDQLALAGWLSAFGANKSGWLNQAIDRGLASGDKRTASFAQRRLAESLVSGGALDSAMRLMQKEPFASDNDTAARVLRAGIVGRTRSQLDAYNTLSALDEELKQRLPIAALRELSAMSNQKPELKLAYQKRLIAVSASGRDTSFAYASLIDGNAAFERATALILPHATSARTLIGLSAQLEQRGRYSWAREVAFVATKLGPNLPDGWEALATARESIVMEEKQSGAAPTDDLRFAQAARNRALALRRGDATKKAEIAFRDGAFEGKKSAAKAKGDDEVYLIDGSVIVERAKKRPAKIGEEFERTLHFQRVVTYHQDKRVSQLIHQAREIVVEPRTQQELYERNIPYEGDEVELVFARVHRKDGTVVQPDEQSSVGAYIKWPQLKTGDVVEYAVRSWTSQPVGRRGDPPYYFFDYVGSTTTRPLLFNEVVVISPEASQLGVDVIGGKADRSEDKIVAGNRVLKFTWDAPPVVADEPMAPQQTEVVPIVVGSTFRSWDDFRTWYQAAIEGFSEPDEQIKRLATEITKGKKTEKEKLEAVFNYVADDIRYVNYTSGEFWLPNRPQQLLARRQGDCDDKANLLISLLKAINVQATPVLVQTRMTAMPSVLSGTKAAVPLFDHGIAYLPGKNGQPGTWLDATSPQSRLGPLPSMDARAKAFFVYDGEAKIVDTLAGNPNDNGVSLNWTVKLAPSGLAEIKGNETHIGDWAFELRNNLIEPDARGQWVEQYLSRWMPTLDLAPEIQYSADKGTLGYAVKAEGYARDEGGELAVPTMGSFSFMSSYASLQKRTLPLVLPPFIAPSHQRRTVTLEAPQGFSFKELPPGGEAKGGAFGSAKVTFKSGKAPRTVLIETEVVFDKSTISVADYPAFRKWLESVDSLIRQTVRLTPDGAAKPATTAAPAPTKPAAAKPAPAAPAKPGPAPAKPAPKK